MLDLLQHLNVCSDLQGWNQDSREVILLEYIDILMKESGSNLADFRRYLQKRADEENKGCVEP